MSTTKSKSFTADWVSGVFHRWSSLLGKFKNQEGLNFLEIGSFEGKSTCWFLDNILTGANNKIYCVDTFGGSSEHQPNASELKLESLFDRFLNNTAEYKDKVVVCRGYSNVQLRSPKIANTLFDFVYVDGAHDACNVLRDAVLSFELLKPKGIMLFDDYQWAMYSGAKGVEDPKLGIDSFLACYEGKYRLLFKEYQVAIEKL